MRNRKRNRMYRYDYSLQGGYFVTICTKNRRNWFGRIEAGEMDLSKSGQIAYDGLWSPAPQYARLPIIVGSYKSAVTKLVNRQYPEKGFGWQKSYYDHIIRDERSFHRIQEYIKNNPLQWDDDIHRQLASQIN